MRIALFGGSFDPPHRGHLAMAKLAADEFRLDHVLLVPTGRQPLKPKGATASYPDRLRMVERMAELDGRFSVSEIDAPHLEGRPNFTVDVLARLHEQNPEDELFAIAGADSFLEIPHWYQPERLLQLAEWIVVSRPGFSLERLAELGLSPEQLGRIHLITTLHDEVSATELRRRLQTGQGCAELIPPPVLSYIQCAKLYGSV